MDLDYRITMCKRTARTLVGGSLLVLALGVAYCSDDCKHATFEDVSRYTRFTLGVSKAYDERQTENNPRYVRRVEN